MTYVIKLNEYYVTTEGFGEPLPSLGFKPTFFSTLEEAKAIATVFNKLRTYTKNESEYKVYKFTEEEIVEKAKAEVKHEAEIEV